MKNAHMRKRYKHNLSHYNLNTGDLGQILPIAQYDVLPGDTVQQATNVLIRMSTLAVPVMHPVQVGIYSFFTPNRILDDNWEDFITGAGATPPATFTLNNSAYTLAKAMGLDPTCGEAVNAYHFYAYNMIRNEYFMDKDIQTPQALASASVIPACWNKDHFTTIRASAQQGTAVAMPLGDTAPIIGLGVENANAAAGAQTVRETDGTSTTAYTDGWNSSTQHIIAEEDPSNANYPNIRADLSNATGATVSEFLESLAMQSYAEARNKYGDTYTDYLRYLGVNPRDSRLQRPEFLGGGRSMIQFSEVLNQSATTGDLGDMGGHGIAAVRTPKFRRFIPEHGVINTVMVVRPLHMLGNGIGKNYLKSAKEDYYQHELRNIGDQEVLNKEIYSSHSTPDGTFGYAPRYDEYRHIPNIVGNEMLDAVYDDYHFARLFTSDPALNDTYVKCQPSQRCFADGGTNANFLFMANHNIVARRPVPREPVPMGGLL